MNRICARSKYRRPSFTSLFRGRAFLPPGERRGRGGKRMTLASALSLMSLLLTVPACAQSGEPAPAGNAVRALLRSGAYEEAAQTADKKRTDGEPETDEWRFLKARALFLAEQYESAAREAETLTQIHPESKWFHKARFLQAEARAKQRDYQTAQAIYGEEAERLLSAERKENIARILIDLADEWAEEPDDARPDASAPEYERAYRLYNHALDLEIGREVIDELLFKKTRAKARAEDHRAARRDARAYLENFDPDWAAGQDRMVEKRGAHWVDVRLLLIRAHIGLDQSGAARREIEDLLAMTEDETEAAGKAADLRWRMIETYRLPAPEDLEAERGIAAARRFLERHPDDPRAVQAAWLIPQTLQNLGRADAARQAYNDFLEARDYRPPEGPEARESHPDLDASPAEILEECRPRALFRMGQLAFAQRDYDAAIDHWQRYVNRHPNGADWSDAHSGAVDARLYQGLSAFDKEDESTARKQLESFLDDFPTDDRISGILFLFGEKPYTRALELKAEEADQEKIHQAFQDAITEWQTLLGRFPKSDEASLAQYRIGRIQEEEFGAFEAALQTYRELTWGPFKDAARERIEQMTQTALNVDSERTFRTDETPQVRVETRNIEALNVRVYRVDMEAYFRNQHSMEGIDALDVSLIEPEETWTHEIEDYEEYLPFATVIDIPFEGDEAGARVVHISDDEEWQATTLVLRSDLELIVKSSLREALVFAQDMRDETVAPEVDLLFSDGASIFKTGRTGEDGVFHTASDDLEEVSTLRVLAKRDGHVAGHNLDLSALNVSAGLRPRGYIYTDRSVYQPGETVSARGILRDVRDGEYVVPDTSFSVQVLDSDGRLVREETTELSPFGTFDTEFPLPEAAALGEYTLHAESEEGGEATLSFSGTFNVQRVQLEKARIQFDFPQRVYFRGETVEARISADYYWGEPIPHAAVRYTLPDGREWTVRADEEGQLDLSFDTTHMTPGEALSFKAVLEEENVTARGTVFLARLGFSAAVETARETVLAGEPFEATVTTTGADEKPVGRSLTLSVIRRVEEQKTFSLDGLPDVNSGRREKSEVTVAEYEIETDEETGTARQQLELDTGGEYILRVAGTDRFDQPVTAEGRVHISDEEDETRLRLFADSETVNVGDETTVQLHSRARAALALVTEEGETLLDYDIVPIEEGFNDLPLAIGHKHFPNMTLSAALIDGRELRTASLPFTVQRQLNVELIPSQEIYAPGEDAQIELRVTDQQGQPVEAELSLALIEEALFSLYSDETPPILDFFQRDARRHAEFETGSTCGFAYAGATLPMDEAVLAERERLERQVREAGLRRDAREKLAEGMLFDRVAPAPAALAGIRASDEEVTARRLEVASEMDALDIRARPPAEPPAEPDPEPREEWPDAGFWIPDVVTDEEGRAVVEIPMPEKTTEWRLTARGVTPETLVGEAVDQTITRQDFFVSLRTPPFIREGDTLRVIGRVHNLTDTAGEVSLQLDVEVGEDGERSVARRTDRVAVAAGKGGEALFRNIEVPPELDLYLTLSAELEDEHRDAVRVRVPAVPWGMEQADHAGGVTDIDATALLTLPEEMAFKRQWMTVSVGPDVEQSIIDMALDGGVPPLPGPVFGGSPAGQLLGAVHTLNYARQSAAATADTRRLASRVRALIGSLVASQQSDGGWTWHPRPIRNSDWAVTSEAYWALVMARDAGFTVDADTLDNASNFLQNSFRQFGATAHEAKAVVLHALAVNNEADFAHLNRLYRERTALGNTALAYTAMAFARLDRADFARELTDRLLANQPNAGSLWPHEAEIGRLQSDAQTTALTLLTLALVVPDHDAGHDIAELLLEQWGSGGRGIGPARGTALTALAEWFGQTRIARADLEIEVRVNDRTLTSIRTRDGFERITLPVPEEYLMEGRNRVEFLKQGTGRYTYAASLYGFSPEFGDPQSWRHPSVRSRKTYHEELRYDGRPLGVRSTSEISKLESGQRTRVEVRLWSSRFDGYLLLEEPLPAGAALVEDSVQGSFEHYEQHKDRLVFYFRPNSSPGSHIRYELVGLIPGEYRLPPTLLRDALRPGRMRVGEVTGLTVLAPGEKSNEPYQKNKNELFALGEAYFEDGHYREALTHLSELHRRDREHRERDVVRMLLWIYTHPDFYEPRPVVEMFEVLRERHPELEIPFDKILVVGRAYRDIEEYERAWLIYRSTIAAGFVSDSNISAILEDEERFLASIDYQRDLWLDYPDSADVVSAYFSLTQALYNKAPDAHELPEEEGEQPEKIGLLTRSSRMLMEFLALYPESPLADDAAFSLANAFLDLRDYDTVVELGERFAERYEESPLVGSFRYIAALGRFWKGEHEQALDAAKAVAESDSPDRTFARYIVGQIHHALGQPRRAIEWYRRVEDEYADAAEAIAYFESQTVELDEVQIFRPGESVSLKLSHRNIDEVALQVYKVDLMRLFLREKDLNRITDIHLAGIAPLQEKSLSLADEPDYRDLETEIELDIEEEGAYLVICRGDDRFTSGLALVTPLDIEVQDQPEAGRLRAHVLDAVTGNYRPRVHVKAIGSEDDAFREGDTDLRGIFIADDLRGTATVIAREGESRYAFHRGDSWYGPSPGERQPRERPALAPATPDYQENLRRRNVEMQRKQIETFDRSRRVEQRGVEVQHAY